MARRKAKDPLDYLRGKVMGSMSMQKGLQTRTSNVMGDPIAVDIQDPSGGPFRFTGFKTGDTVKQGKNNLHVLREGIDPIQSAAEMAAATSKYGGSEGSPNTAAIPGIAEQYRNHPLLKGKSVEEQRILLQKAQNMSNWSGVMAGDAYDRTFELLQQDPKKIEVLKLAGVIDERQAKLLSGEALPADEVEAKANGLPWADWIPFVKDMPVEQRLPIQVGGIALAGAGATAGSIAMANMLMQQGQQQLSANDYAAAVQSLNAY